MKKQKTKEHLLEKGAMLMNLKGYNNTGIQEIVDLCKVPKGSFYFYFESKEYFGLELINYFAAIQQEKIVKFFKDSSFAPIDKFENYFNNFFEELARNDFKGGSFLGNFIQELADVNEMFRQGLAIVNEQVIDCFAAVIKEMNDNQNAITCRKSAELLYFSFEGVVMQVKLYRSLEPVKNLLQLLNSISESK